MNTVSEGNNSVIKGWLHQLKRSRTPSLGQRELNALDVVWAKGQCSAQDVLDELDDDVSLSTVQSTLERLHRKTLVQRTKSGRAFLYQAKVTRSELISSLIHDIRDDFGAEDGTALIVGFIDFLASTDPDLHQRMRGALEN
ncbi:MAG: BlaI/MecI/CopY family transcriptional regulator, partial [Pseudomonadota bacterium]|nr:BlaI/MecI/CopY family transcriptional regulator [Pseudomonadota bacterium]